MGDKIRRGLTFAMALLGLGISLSAQSNSGQTDSLIRLMKGSSVQLIEEYGHTYRKAIDATFLHNNTYLICDTALWDVDMKMINCIGNVKLMQEETVLTSDRMDYMIDDNLAEFRGGIVQLQNRQNNVLRTRNLDYNTKDSVALFRGGAAMKDKDGQVIESRDGDYDSKSKVFHFTDMVNMYTDSVFVKTDMLVYYGDRNMADFLTYIDFWNEDKMLSAGRGWYKRDVETFFFQDNVHGMSSTQEVWSDSLYVYRNDRNVELLGNAQVRDSSRKVSGVANYIFYDDSVSRVTMCKDAAVTMETEQKGQTDTLYAGADTLVYYSLKKCDIPQGTFDEAKSRLEDLHFDPVTEYRRKAAEAAEKAKAEAEAEAIKNDPNKAAQAKASAKASDAASPKQPSVPQTAENADAGAVGNHGVSDSMSAKGAIGVTDSLAVSDSLGVTDSLGMADSLAVADSLAIADSLGVQQDTIPPLDTTRIGFALGIGNVRIFRKDIQIRCDSLYFSEIDSLARFYKHPVVWNEGNRQYSSDSLFVLVANGGIERASLASNAFIITKEDSLCFDQIKSTEIMAYFDSTSALRRFDALGGASAMFFLQENDAYSTVNKVESKMLSAIFKNGDVDRIYYFDSPKNDAYPVAQLSSRDFYMKDFNWQDNIRPKGPEDITAIALRTSERRMYESHPRTTFQYTKVYFPGYIESVYDSLKVARIRRDARRRDAERNKAAAQSDTLTLNGDGATLTDSLALKADNVSVSDSLVSAPDSVTLKDSLAVRDSLAAKDSLAAGVDSLLATPPTKKELREEARKLAIAKRDAHWAELDARDAEKAAAKAQKKLEKQRERTRRAVILRHKQEKKDQEKLQKYIERYEKKKAREDARNAERAARKQNRESSGEAETPVDAVTPGSQRDSAMPVSQGDPGEADNKEKPVNIKNEQQQHEPSGERAPKTPPGRILQTPVEFRSETP